MGASINDVKLLTFKRPIERLSKRVSWPEITKERKIKNPSGADSIDRELFCSRQKNQDPVLNVVVKIPGNFLKWDYPAFYFVSNLAISSLHSPLGITLYYSSLERHLYSLSLFPWSSAAYWHVSHILNSRHSGATHPGGQNALKKASWQASKTRFRLILATAKTVSSCHIALMCHFSKGTSIYVS